MQQFDMQIIPAIAPVDAPKGSAVALGFFDGVHLGHRAVISAAVTEARKAESNSVGSSTSQSGKNASSTANPVVDSRIEIDQSTRTVIFQKIDQGTGDVISQVPEESMLRMHAAMQSQVQAHEQASAAQMSQVDRSV